MGIFFNISLRETSRRVSKCMHLSTTFRFIYIQAYPIVKFTSTFLSALTLPSASSSFPPLFASLASYNHISSPASGVRHMFAMVSRTPLRRGLRLPLRFFGFHKAVAPPMTTPPLLIVLTMIMMSPHVLSLEEGLHRITE